MNRIVQLLVSILVILLTLYFLSGYGDPGYLIAGIVSLLVMGSLGITQKLEEKEIISLTGVAMLIAVLGTYFISYFAPYFAIPIIFSVTIRGLAFFGIGGLIGAYIRSFIK
jgi:hypothetical protein